MSEYFERQELLQKLTKHGFGDLVEAMLSNEGKVYTKKGRLNKSGTCRVLKWKPKALEDALAKCRDVLSKDMALE